MNTSKPKVFFSHSSGDKKALTRLKELFTSKTGGSIDVFLSSDGQSIPLGRNWVHKVQEELERAALMVVFITPQSLRSSWLYFEAGFAYSKKVRVVPVGFLGVDLGSIPPPLSLLQGFNITSEAGLNNLIAISNEEFGHKHLETFTSNDFTDINSVVPSHSIATFGEFGNTIDQITIHLSGKTGLNCEPVDALKRIEEMLRNEKVEFSSSERRLSTHGLSVDATQGILPAPLDFHISPFVADIALPIFERAIRLIRSEGANGVNVHMDFIDTLGCIEARHKLTGKLYGTDTKLAENDGLAYGNIEFHVGYRYTFSPFMAENTQRGPVQLNMKMLSDNIPLDQIRGLLGLLFEREVLFFKSISL